MKPNSIINQLRRHYPGYWEFSRNDCGPTWTNGTTVIRAYSQSHSSYDGDESWISVSFDQDGHAVGSCGMIHSPREQICQ